MPEQVIRTIIMPQIPESLEQDSDVRQYYVELERILTELFGGDQQIAGNLEIGGDLSIFGGLTLGTTLVTTTPYTILSSDNNIFVDTDSMAITLNLPIGTNGKHYRIINTGSSDNDVTVAPDGADLLTGSNASRTLSDSSVIILTYETTKGWW